MLKGYGGGTTNHAWSGGGLTILSQYVAGVSPIEPGFKVFRIAPELAGLSFAKALVPTVNGNIAVSTERDGDKMTIKFNVPKGTAAVVDISRISPGILLSTARNANLLTCISIRPASIL